MSAGDDPGGELLEALRRGDRAAALECLRANIQ